MRTRTVADLLRDHPFFSGMRPADLDSLAGCGTIVRFAPGEVLFKEGEPADSFYVLRRGKVAIEAHVAQRPPVMITTSRAGDVVGWSWLFPPYRWELDARAVEDSSAVVLDGRCLRERCEHDTDLGYRLMQRFARLAAARLAQTRIRLLDIYRAEGDHGRR